MPLLPDDRVSVRRLDPLNRPSCSHSEEAFKDSGDHPDNRFLFAGRIGVANLCRGIVRSRRHDGELNNVSDVARAMTILPSEEWDANSRLRSGAHVGKTVTFRDAPFLFRTNPSTHHSTYSPPPPKKDCHTFPHTFLSLRSCAATVPLDVSATPVSLHSCLGSNGLMSKQRPLDSHLR